MKKGKYLDIIEISKFLKELMDQMSEKNKDFISKTFEMSNEKNISDVNNEKEKGNCAMNEPQETQIKIVEISSEKEDSQEFIQGKVIIISKKLS